MSADGASADPPIQQFAAAAHPPLVGDVRTPSPAPELVQLPFSTFVIPSATGESEFSALLWRNNSSGYVCTCACSWDYLEHP